MKESASHHLKFKIKLKNKDTMSKIACALPWDLQTHDLSISLVIFVILCHQIMQKMIKSQNYKFPPIENTSKSSENDAWYAETYLQWFLQSNFEKLQKLQKIDFSADEASQLDDIGRARHPSKIES